jgi:hypothetical protein
MVCKILLENFTEKINVEKLKLGLPFNLSPVNNHTEVSMKYKIYKDDQTRRKNGTFLQLIIVEGEKGFKINGSLRKWWFGDANYEDDLDFKTFIRCIKCLAKRLGIAEAVLWASGFTYLEFGANIVYESSYRVLLDCIVGFPRRKIKLHQDETIGFKLTTRETHTIYDKVAEIRKNGGMYAAQKKDLDEKIFALRFEMKLNPTDFRKITGSERCTLMDIKFHWESIVAQWMYDFMEIELYNRLPLTAAKSDLTTVTDIKDFLIVLGLEAYGGMRQVKALIYGNKNIRKKGEIYKAFLESYPPNRELAFEDFKQDVYDQMFDRARKLL